MISTSSTTFALQQMEPYNQTIETTLDLFVFNLLNRYSIQTPIVIHHINYEVKYTEALYINNDSFISYPDTEHTILTNIFNSQHFAVEVTQQSHPSFVLNPLQSQLIVRRRSPPISTYTSPESQIDPESQPDHESQPYPNEIDPMSKNILIGFAIVLIIVACYEAAIIFKL